MRFYPEFNRLTQRFAAAALLALMGIVPFEALAWGPKGHRIVAIVADANLKPEIRDKYQKDFNIPDLAAIANWADAVKRQRDEGPWHYLNLPEGERAYRKRRDCPDGHCVLEKILDFSRILEETGQSPSERKEALMYLVHFVADIHQPLHLGYAADRGGNEIPVEFEGEPTDLHALWDEGLIGAEDLVQYARGLNARITASDREKWAAVSVTGWAQESRAVVLDHVYRFGTTGGRPDKTYVEQSREIIALRLSQAGVRLAQLLNALLDPGLGRGM